MIPLALRIAAVIMITVAVIIAWGWSGGGPVETSDIWGWFMTGVLFAVASGLPWRR